MSALRSFFITVAVAVLPSVLGAVVGFVLAFMAMLVGFGAFDAGSSEWSGANQSAVGMMGLMAGGVGGFFGFVLGALYSVRRLSRAVWRAEVC